MNGPDAPPAPDPKQTAQYQTQMNKDTAVAQYGLNATNQRTPWGNMTYKQVGQWQDGTPRFEMSIDLSPEEGEINTLNQMLRRNVGRIGQDASAAVHERLKTPFKLGNEEVEGRLFDLGRKRLDPMNAQRRAATETDLINRGIRPGMEAYKRAMGAVGEQENDAINQLLFTGRGQAISEQMAERNQLFNEIASILSGSQVQQPNFGSTPQPGVAPTDFIGAQGQSLAQQNVGFNAKQQQHMGLMNGLFGLGKTALGGWMGG